ncbi:MAG: hypothetical protein ACTHQM_24230 [Thermoanaerobaculia bacterium]
MTHRKDKSANYAHFWYLPRDTEYSEDELSDLHEAGYFFVNTKEFDVKRWTESADGRIKNGRKFLMALSEENYDAQFHERMTELGIVLDTDAAPFHSLAEQQGLGTFETRGGRTRNVINPKRTAAF